MRRRTTELLEAHILAGHRLHDIGPRDEHVRRLLDHQDEVGDRRGVDGASRARAHDERDLGDHARRLDVPPEDLRVARERHDALLDARSPRIVDPYQRASVPHGHVHDLADLLGEDLREGAPEDGEVLGEDEHAPPEDRSVAGDDRIAPGTVLVHPELDLAVAHEAVELDEGSRVEELLDPLAGEQLSALALTFDVRVTRVIAGFFAELLEPAELRLGRVVNVSHRRGA